MAAFSTTDADFMGGGEPEWADDRKLVMHELRVHGKRLEHIDATVNRIHLDMTRMQVKNSILWGVMGGSLTVMIPVLVKFFL